MRRLLSASLFTTALLVATLAIAGPGNGNGNGNGNGGNNGGGVTGEAFDIAAANLSSAPSLVDAPLSVSFGTQSDLFGAELSLPKGAAPGAVRFHLRGLEVDRIASMLRLGEGSLLSGGTVELSLDGPWMDGKAGYIDLPLDVTLRDVNLALGGSHSFPLSELKVPVHLRGPLDGLNLKLDHGALMGSLRDAGAAELASFVEAEKERLMAEGMAELQGVVDGELKGELEGLLGTELDLDVTDLDASRAEPGCSPGAVAGLIAVLP